jgi:hypothetical protein
VSAFKILKWDVEERSSVEREMLRARREASTRKSDVTV